MKMKKFFVFAALILAAAAVVFAQQMAAGSLGMPGFTSPQSIATQTRFRSAADNFIRPDSYTGVAFDKFYAMTSFQFTNRAQLGYATKIGGLYLGASYGGSFWANYTPLNYTEQDFAGWPGGSKKVSVYDFDPDSPFVSGIPENRVAILIGVADMGFRLAFSSVNHESISVKESVVGGNAVKSYEAAKGSLIPQIAWAMAKDLSENGIRPYVVVDLDFERGYVKEETAMGVTSIRSSENHFDPKLTLGLGGYTFYKNDSNFRLSADFEYAIGLKIYSNEYTYTEAGNIKIGTIKGLNRGGSPLGGLTENSYNGHLITPALAGQWSDSLLAFRFRLNLPVTLISEKSTAMTPNGSGLDSGVKDSSFYIGFSPNLQLATQWKIIPKLTLNAGGRITLNAIGRTSIDTDLKTPAYSYSSHSVVKVFNNTTNNLTVGVTFLPLDALTFEASCGIGTNNSISVFDPSGLFSFTSLLVGLKF